MSTTGRFGKFENGLLTCAPYPLVVDGQKLYTTADFIYNENGWYTLISSKPSEKSGYYFTDTWVADDKKMTLTQVWIEHPLDPSETDVRFIEMQEEITIYTESLLYELTLLELGLEVRDDTV